MLINDLYTNKKPNLSEGMEGQVVFSGTGTDGGTYEIIQSGPSDFMIHANGRHIDTYGSLQRAMSVLKNEVPGLQQGVAEGAPELLKAEMPLVRHIEKELAQHGYEKGTPEYGQMFKHSMAMYRKFGNVDAIKKGVAEGEHPKTWRDVDPKLGKQVDKMSQAEKVSKGFAHSDTLKKKTSFIQKLDAKLQQLGYTPTQEGNVYRWTSPTRQFVEVEPNTEDPGWYGWAEGQVTRSGKLRYGSSGNDSAKDIVSIFKSGGVFRKQGVAEGMSRDEYNQIQYAIDNFKDEYGEDPTGPDIFDIADSIGVEPDAVINVLYGRVVPDQGVAEDSKPRKIAKADVLAKAPKPRNQQEYDFIQKYRKDLAQSYKSYNPKKEQDTQDTWNILPRRNKGVAEGSLNEFAITPDDRSDGKQAGRWLITYMTKDGTTKEKIMVGKNANAVSKYFEFKYRRKPLSVVPYIDDMDLRGELDNLGLDEQGMAEGMKAHELSQYCEELVAEKGWDAAYKHALMMANMGRDPAWNGVLKYLDAMKQGVAEGVAETVSMDQAKKVLGHYGADNFKTTTNELHFYKNGRHMSVDLIFNDDATRSVSLSQLNSATRRLKGQGVAEGTLDEAVGMMIKGAAISGANDQDIADRIAAKTGGRVDSGSYGHHVLITYPTTQHRAEAAVKIRKMFPGIELYKSGGNRNAIDEQGMAKSSQQQWRVTVGNKSGTLSHTKVFTGTKEQAIKQAVRRFATTRNPVVHAELADQGMAEGSGPVTHRIGLTVTDPNHPMVSKRGETYQKTVRVTGNDREDAINQAIAHHRRKGYKVHDHHYIGTVDDEPVNELSKDTIKNYVKAQPARIKGPAGLATTNPKKAARIVDTEKGDIRRALTKFKDPGYGKQQPTLDEVSLGDYRKKATVNKAVAQTDRFFGRDDAAKVAAADQTIAKRERGLARADARSKPYTPPQQDAEKQQRDLTAKYPNIDDLVAAAERNRDPYYDRAEGNAYYAGREAEQNYQKLKQIQRVIQGLNESLDRSHLP